MKLHDKRFPGESRAYRTAGVDLIWPLWNLFDFTPEGEERTGIRILLMINQFLFRLYG
ncbi:MAG: hypothetical protein ACRDFC_05910 [Ignavibacteria bacterium]